LPLVLHDHGAAVGVETQGRARFKDLGSAPAIPISLGGEIDANVVYPIGVYVRVAGGLRYGAKNGVWDGISIQQSHLSAD
jgi:hypothetical protein